MFSLKKLSVFAPYSIQSDLGGACGKFNNDSSDDKTTRDGKVTGDVNEMLGSWFVSSMM